APAPGGRAVENFKAGRWSVLNRVLDIVRVVNELEFEDGGFADQFFGALGVLDPGQLHEDFIVTLAHHGGLSYAELGDSIANRLERLVHYVGLHLCKVTRPETQAEGGSSPPGRRGVHHQVGK